MGIIKKIKEIFKDLDDLEKPPSEKPDEDEEVEGDEFDAILGQMIASLEKTKKKIGKIVRVPVYFILYLSPPDREDWLEAEEDLKSQLLENLLEKAQTYDERVRKVEMEIVTDEALTPGVRRVEAFLTPRKAAVKNAPPNAPDDLMTRVDFSPEPPARPREEAATIVQPETRRIICKIIEAGKRGAKNYEFAKREILIGRDPECDIRISSEDTSVSRRQAMLRIEQGQVQVTRLGQCSMYLNGSALPLNQPLSAPLDARLEIDTYTFTIQSA